MLTETRLVTQAGPEPHQNKALLQPSACRAPALTYNLKLDWILFIFPLLPGGKQKATKLRRELKAGKLS